MYWLLNLFKTKKVKNRRLIRRPTGAIGEEKNFKKSAEAIEDRPLTGKMATEENKTIELSSDDQVNISEGINKEPSKDTADRLLMEADSRGLSSSKNDQEDDKLKSAKAEMGEVIEENERLKLILSQIVKDYNSLQMHFFDIAKQESPHQRSTNNTPLITHQEDEEEEDELVSLSLGRSHSSESKRDERKINTGESKSDEIRLSDELGPELGLDSRFEPSDQTENVMNPSLENCSEEEHKEEEVTETWPPSKILKTRRSGEDELLQQQTQLKRARVSVRARCDTPTMNDGCQWRKYGQKIAKGNPCPRAYYRCTVSPSCPVRKQVQRCVDDMTILITTYEGNHNHPLPLSATAMASTTSAAASMIQSGSSTSQPSYGASVTSTATSTTANLHGFNFTALPHNPSKSHQFYFPNSSISTSNAHPTITLDLTAPIPSHFTRFPSTNIPYASRFSSSLNFSSSSPSSFSSDSNNNTLQTKWGNGYQFSYGTLSFNRSNQVGSLSLGNNNHQPPKEQYFYQPPPPHMQKIVNQNAAQPNITETLAAAATKAIASNPTLRSALEAAITSCFNNGGGGGFGGDNKFGHNLKWGESFSQEQARGLMLFPPAVPLSTTSKSASLSPTNERDHIK